MPEKPHRPTTWPDVVGLLVLALLVLALFILGVVWLLTR